MKQIIDDISAQLQAAYPEDEARSMAWWIAEELTGRTRTELQFGCKGTTFSPIMQEKVQKIISRLLHFEPIQYIFGHTLWCGLDLKVSPATLIPRPETAELVERINARMANDPMAHGSMVRVLDIGTGSGCIAIALKKAHPEWQVTGIDISPEAIKVACENARRNDVEVHFQVADILDFRFSILDSRFSGPFDLVVSNPPYICEHEKVSMRPNVLDFEPSSALFVPDEDPLLFYRRIAELVQGTAHDEHHSLQYLFFEINEAYATQVSVLLEGLGYTDIQITQDIYGKDRIIDARMAR